MSHTFAKLYTKKDRQVLVTKETDDDDCPAVAFRTTTKSGHSLTIEASFKDGQWDERDEAFARITEAQAWASVAKSPGIDL